MTSLDRILEIPALGAAIWVFVYQLPRARREQDAFAVICSVLTGLLALLLWAFVGIGVS